MSTTHCQSSLQNNANISAMPREARAAGDDMPQRGRLTAPACFKWVNLLAMLSAKFKLGASAACLALWCLFLPSFAAAQVMTLVSASPTTFSAAGEVITFNYTFDQSNAVTASVSISGANVTLAGFSCAGLPLAVNGATTCSGTYTTTALDVSNGIPIQQVGGLYSALPPSGTPPRGGSITGSVSVPFVAPAITILPGTLPVLTAGTVFSQALNSSGGTAPYTYALQSGSLPVGVSLSAGGTVSGIPTQRGAYSFTVRATDNISQFADRGFTGTVQNPSLSITPSSATAIQGVAFSRALSTAGGVVPHTYLLEAGAFPASISISSAGVVSGTTAAAPGDYPVYLRVTDASTGTGSYFEIEYFTLTVSPPPSPSVSIAVAPASVSEDGATNLVYTVTRSLNLASATVVNITTGGTATSGTDYTGGVATVTIPAGATQATITISPAVDGTVEADESVILTVAAGLGYTVGTPASATGTILNDDVPTASITVAPTSVAEDGAANLVYTVTLNQASLSNVSVNFTVSGTATSGTDYATITSPLVISAGNTTGSITVNPAADAAIESDDTVILTLAAGTGYTVGAPNSATGTILNDDVPNLTINDVTANEGNAGTTNFTFTVSLSAPAGPGGVTFDIATANGSATAGVDYVASSLTGQTIPANSSTYTFTVLVNGDALNEVAETFFVNVTNVTNATVVDGQGVGTIVDDDALPSLSINDVTVIEGNSGTVNAVFTVTLSPASGQNVTVNYLTSGSTATAGTDYTATSGQLTFTPGQTSKTITVAVNGDTTPESDEIFFVNLTGSPPTAIIADNQGIGTITNDDVPITVSPATVPNAAVGAAYSQTLTGSGGTSPYTFSVTAGALPAGLTLTAGGVLSGTPSAGGTFNFTVTATDSSAFPGPYAGSRGYTLTVTPPTISLPAVPLSGGTLGAVYSASITAASGGTAPYTYSVTPGALPGGLNINTATGAITGTPNALGTFAFNVTATDSSTGTGPFTGNRGYSITIIDVAPVANLVSKTVAYNAATSAVALNITGGAATSVAIGTAPANGTAVVSGAGITYKPTVGYAGLDSFTYTATNSGGTSAPATVTITVSNPVPLIGTCGSLNVTVGAPFNCTFTWTGGAQPWSNYQATGLPSGLNIGVGGANSVTISGTTQQVGIFNVNVSATDSSTGNGPFTIGQAYTLSVAAPTITLTPTAGTLTATYGVAYSLSFAGGGGAGNYSYGITGTLPAGLNFSGNVLSGTPTVPGNYPVTITATDAQITGSGSPFSRANNYTINVPAPTIVVNPATLPSPVTVTSAYNQTLTASGGVASYNFTLSAGALPTGLTLTTGGAISGNTSAAGTFNFTVTASDANNQTGARAYAVTVDLQTQTVTFAPTATVTFGVAPITLTASTTSGLTAFTFASTTPLVCTVAADVVTIVGAGTCALSATQPGSALFATASANASINVLAIQPTITVVATTPLVYNTTTTLSITGGAGTGAVSYVSNNTNCTIASAQLTAAAVGTCDVTATKAADGANAQASSAPFTITINKAPQATLTATATPPVLAFNGTTALGSTGGNGLGTVSWASSDTLKCTIASNILTAVGVGTCDVVATKTTDANYLAASSVVLTITINKAVQTPVLVASAASTTVGFGSTTTLSTTGGAGVGTVSYSSSNVDCAIAGNVLTANAATGTCDITATKLTDANYLQATSTNTLTITLSIATQTINFNAVNNRFLNEGNFVVAATGGASLNPVTFASQTTAVCTTGGLNGTSITVLRVGTCTLRASQAGNANYAAAATVDRSLSIVEVRPNVTVSIAAGSEGLGSITQVGTTEVALNTVLNLNVVANPRYVTRMSGTCGGSITTSTAFVPQGAGSNNYRTGMIGTDCTIIARFEAVRPVITVSGSAIATLPNVTPAQTFSVVAAPATFTAKLYGAIGVLNFFNTATAPVFIAFQADGVAIAGCEQQAITRTFTPDESITQASCTTTALGLGNRVITASFSGDNYNFPAETSTTATPTQALTHVIIAEGAPPPVVVPPVVIPPVVIPPVVIPPVVIPPVVVPPGSSTLPNLPVSLPPITLTLQPVAAPTASAQTPSNPAAANGTVTPNGVNGVNGAGGVLDVGINSTVDLAITANPRYLANVTGTCGGRVITSQSLVPQGAGSNIYRTAEVGQQCTVVINFNPAIPTITVSGSNGITPINATPVMSTSTADQPATFTATMRQAIGVIGLNRSSPSTVYISFYADGVPIVGCEQQVITQAFGFDDSYHQASCSTASLPLGMSKITVSFSGDKYNFPAITDSNKTPTPVLTHVVQ